jgi:hypothetical protein
MNRDEARGLPDFLMDGFTACLDRASLEALAKFKLSRKAQNRLKSLAEGANEGTISPEEKEEYLAFITRSELLAHAQLLARARLGLPLAS